jgi:hypothetical protein
VAEASPAVERWREEGIFGTPQPATKVARYSHPNVQQLIVLLPPGHVPGLVLRNAKLVKALCPSGQNPL